MDATPLVSICCATYNHEEFIADAIEGFLMQEVDFPVEILINDDASTDSTPEILRAYEQRFPARIRVIYQEENQYSKGVRPLAHILFPKARGKYIALCEGDDYWTDPQKLLKQVEYMEAHPECSITCGGYESIIGAERTRVIEGMDCSSPGLGGFCFDLADMSSRWITKTLTVVFRADALCLEDLQPYATLRDVHLFYHIVRNGRGYYFQDVLGVYNVHSGGVHSMADASARRRAAYAVYKELYAANRDWYSRAKAFDATVGMISESAGRPAELRWRVRLMLGIEALSLARTIREFLLIPVSFFGEDARRAARRLAHGLRLTH